uniref:hypothetical protein 41 n=1 Tax=Moniliophthora perniciosa TaxID=153609 RepID=UPI0000242336|nr:hypothetical protein 41 [Moniliophthora perniciosa]AAQ74334.1 hypothetical protein 41 [Moniliophthora perniciosa]
MQEATRGKGSTSFCCAACSFFLLFLALIRTLWLRIRASKKKQEVRSKESSACEAEEAQIFLASLSSLA